MTDIIAMHSAEPVIFGVVKIVWKDGFAGIVDLRPLLAKGEMFEFLPVNPARFDDLKLEEHGHKIFWLDDQGDEIEYLVTVFFKLEIVKSGRIDTKKFKHLTLCEQRP